MTLPPAPASPPIDSVGTAPKPSVIHRVARTFRRPGLIWRSCSAAIASPARSRPLLRYWQTSQIPATPTSITPWQQAHAGDASLHVCHFPRPFRRPVDADPGVRRAPWSPAAPLPQAATSSFDHLVGKREQRGWDFEAKCLRGVQVDDELELGRLHHWQISGLFAFENTTGVNPALAIQIRQAVSVT